MSPTPNRCTIKTTSSVYSKVSHADDSYDRDAVVKQWLAEDDHMKNVVNMERLEDGKNGDWVDGGEQRREDERIEQRQLNVDTEHSSQTGHPQR